MWVKLLAQSNRQEITYFWNLPRYFIKKKIYIPVFRVCVIMSKHCCRDRRWSLNYSNGTFDYFGRCLHVCEKDSKKRPGVPILHYLASIFESGIHAKSWDFSACVDSVWLFVYMNEVKTTEQTSFLNHWLNWTEIH